MNGETCIFFKLMWHTSAHEEKHPLWNFMVRYATSTELSLVEAKQKLSYSTHMFSIKWTLSQMIHHIRRVFFIWYNSFVDRFLSWCEASTATSLVEVFKLSRTSAKIVTYHFVYYPMKENIQTEKRPGYVALNRASLSLCQLEVH